MSSFRFGAPNAGPGGCCGMPEGCTSLSRGCVFKVRKKAWHAAVAALPKCVECGMNENHTAHVVALDSGWAYGGLVAHKFAQSAAASEGSL